MTRWTFSLEARSPKAPFGTWMVGVSSKKIDQLKRSGHEAKLARVLLLPKAVSEPERIYQGWTRLEKEECFIYASKPGRDWKSKTIEVPAPPDQFFLVFVLPDGTIDDWNWRLSREGGVDQPQGSDGRILWPPQE